MTALLSAVDQQPAPLPAEFDRNAAFVDLVAEHRSAMTAYATRLAGGDHAWAEDVVQEAFVRAWRHLDRLLTTPGSVRGWLLRVTHNLVVDGYRAVKARPTEVEMDTDARVSGPDETIAVLDQLLVRRALAILPAEHRDAIVETYLHDRTAAQAAVVLGVPTGTVKSRVFYGLRRLRESMDTGALAS